MEGLLVRCHIETPACVARGFLMFNTKTLRSHVYLGDVSLPKHACGFCGKTYEPIVDERCFGVLLLRFTVKNTAVKFSEQL